MKKTLKIFLLVCCLSLCAVSMVACSLSDAFDSFICDHAFDSGFVAEEPTCSKPGVLIKTCANCGLEEKEEIATLEHLLVELPAELPTCSKSGKTSGTICKICETVVVKPIVLFPKGHTIVFDEAVEPTCLMPGLTTGSHCSICDFVVDKQIVLPALGHKLVSVDQLLPTCYQKGHSAFSYCTTCNVKYGYEEYSFLEHELENGYCKNCSYFDSSFFDLNDFDTVLSFLNNSSKFTRVKLETGKNYTVTPNTVFYGDNCQFTFRTILGSPNGQFLFNPLGLSCFSGGEYYKATNLPRKYLFSNGSFQGIYKIPIEEFINYESIGSSILADCTSIDILGIDNIGNSGSFALYMYEPIKLAK
jgi:hypothetical protein